MGALQPGTNRCGASLLTALMALGLSGCVGDFLTMPGHKSGSAPPPPPRLMIAPESASLTALGDSAGFQAGWWRDGTITPAQGCRWVVADGQVASSTSDGVVVATGNGSTSVTATCSGSSVSAPVGVWQAVASVGVTPKQVDLHIGESDAIQAIARDARGNYLARPVAVGWTSTNELVASVQPDNQNPSHALVTRNFPGSAQIRATVEGATGTTTVK